MKGEAYIRLSERKKNFYYLRCIFHIFKGQYWYFKVAEIQHFEPNQSFCCFFTSLHPLQASLCSLPRLPQPVLARGSTCPLSYPPPLSPSSPSPPSSSSSPPSAGLQFSAPPRRADPPWALWVGLVLECQSLIDTETQARFPSKFNTNF